MLKPVLVTVFAFFASTAPQPVLQSFEMRVPEAPRPFMIEGGEVLRYELHLTNFAGTARSVDRIEALDSASGRIIGALEGSALAGASSAAGRQAASVTAGPGERLVVYWELRPPKGSAAPVRIRHRLYFDGGSVAGAETTPSRSSLPTLGPPLRGGPWAAAYDPALERGHRRMIYAVDGSAHIPGRYAIDWFSAGPSDGRGAEVLAVASATVAAVRDDVQDPNPSDKRGPVPLADATGNFVALKLSDGSFAVYEHLQHSVAVRVGQRVAKGQVIAKVGATGQARRAHLHFHVANGTSSLAAEGLPFRMAGITVLGQYLDVALASSGGAWVADKPFSLTQSRTDMPKPNMVVRFD